MYKLSLKACGVSASGLSPKMQVTTLRLLARIGLQDILLPSSRSAAHNLVCQFIMHATAWKRNARCTVEYIPVVFC